MNFTYSNNNNNNNKNYNTLIEFGKFLRENCDKLFEKDSKLSVKVDQLLILQDYLQPSSILPSTSSSDRPKPNINSKEYLLLYKSNQIHFIQDFLFKITNLKITGGNNNKPNDFVNLNIFGSLIYLEIKNWKIQNIIDLQNLRNQLEYLVCYKCVNKVQDLLHFCGGDQSMPITWSKLHTLNLSYNQLNSLDNSFRLATSIEILDLSHNNLKDCGEYLHHLKKLKKLNLSFNKLESLPSLCNSESSSTVQFIDLSYNNIELLSIENLNKLTNLEEINLRNNLLNNIYHLNHLRLLPNVKNVFIEGNPVNLNPNSLIIIKEIITVIKLKKNLKQRPFLKSFSVNSSSNYKSSSIQTPIAKVNAIKNINNNQTEYAHSVPNSKSYLINQSINNQTTSDKKMRSLTLRQDNKRRLKPNVILIEHDDPNLLENQINESADSDNLNKYSKSMTSHYDPNKLKLEIEMMKKMRQNYGTDWLLSTQNLNSNTILAPYSIKSIEFSQTNLDNETNNPMENINKKDNLSINEIEKNIIDSFAVYRSVEPISNINFDTHDNEHDLNSSVIICILSLSHFYIVERDETNTEILSMNKYNELDDIKFINEDNINKVKITYSNSGLVRSYEFESSSELNNFVEHVHKILFSELNVKETELYYCVWCKEFGKKSKFKLINQTTSDCSDDSNISESIDDHSNLTCTKCNRYLIKDNKILSVDQKEEKRTEAVTSTEKNTNKQTFIDINSTSTPNNSKSLNETFNQTGLQHSVSSSSQSFSNTATFTLKDVLKSLKTNESSHNNSENVSIMSEVEDNFDKKSIGDVSLSKSVNSSISTTLESSTMNPEQSIINEEAKENVSVDDRINSILDNNQISKIKLDEINQKSKRINNNLKLYLIINVLNDSSNDIIDSNKKLKNDNNSNDQEEDLACLFELSYFFNFKYDLTSKNLSNTNNLSIDDSFCLLTNKNLILFRILNKDLFEKHVEFDKSIKKELVLPINQIEVIEISLGQHYVVIESATDDITSGDKKNYSKFVTNDIYRTQAFLNILLKLINESKYVTMLKQIKKKNELTNFNLAELLSKFNKNPIDSDLLSFGLYTFLDELIINDKETNKTYEISSFNLLLYQNEQIVLVEENLAYFNEKTSTKSILDQFNLIHIGSISDIVHLRLFKECVTKLEISFVDESNNSTQVKWAFNLNKEFLLSQLINQLKTVWEKIFFVELPINF